MMVLNQVLHVSSVIKIITLQDLNVYKDKILYKFYIANNILSTKIPVKHVKIIILYPSMV